MKNSKPRLIAALIAITCMMSLTCVYAQEEQGVSAENEIQSEETKGFEAELCDISDHDTLTYYEQINSVYVKGSKIISTQYAGSPDVIVKLNNGTTLSSSYYSVAVSPANTSIGPHTAKVTFKGKYSGCASQSVKFTIIPPAPVSIQLASNQPNALTGFNATADAVGDYIPAAMYIRYSKNRDMSGYKEVKSKDKKTCVVTGLTKSTTYYIKARYESKGNDGKMYSSEISSSILTIKTADETLPAATLANTKSMYSKLKCGEEIVINKRIDEKSGWKFAEQVQNLYPYYMKTFKDGIRAAYNFYFTYERNGLVSQIVFFPEDMSKVSATQKKIDIIVAGANKKKTQADRIKYVNAKIKEACKYDSRAENRRSAYGCLVNGRAVCVGYAETFAWCMNELGIKNKQQYNSKKSHVWNKVYIKYKGKKRWWNVDVTWNDTSHTNKYLLKKTHP